MCYFLTKHIFQNALATKQNGTQEKASFSGIAFVPLHVMGCVLCRVLAPETNFWLIKTPSANKKKVIDGSES